MQLTFIAADARRYALPMCPPMRVHGQPMVRRTGLIVAVRSRSGCVGLGEFAPWPGFGGVLGGPAPAHDLEALAQAFRAFASEYLVGQVLQLPDAHEASSANAAAALGIFGSLTALAPLALQGALQCALLDLLAQRWQLPMAKLLAPHPAQEVRVHALVDSAWEAQNACAKGFTALKIKVGRRSLSDELGTLCAIRSAVGPQVGLRLDANGAWPLTVAVQALRLFSSVAPAWVEQPITADDVAGLRHLKELAIAPIAADESVFDEPSLRRVLQARAVDGVVLKPAFVGGPQEAVRLGRLVQEAGVHLSITHALDSSVGRAAALQVALALGVQDPCGLGGALPEDPGATGSAAVPLLRAQEGYGLGVSAEAWDLAPPP